MGSEPGTAGGFDSPEAAEEAFYTAFREGNFAAMAAVWCEDDDAHCIHPARAALRGVRAVMESWEAILSATETFDIRFHRQHAWRTSGLAVHVGFEEIHSPDGRAVRVAATNAYRLTTTGWLMVLHHASPVQDDTPVDVVH